MFDGSIIGFPHVQPMNPCVLQELIGDLGILQKQLSEVRLEFLVVKSIASL